MRFKRLFLGILLLWATAACSDSNTAENPSNDSENIELTATPNADTGEESNGNGAESIAASPEGELDGAEQPLPTADHPLINEIQVGVEGNNNTEFIELYNPTDKAIDLNGWSLWHQIRGDENPFPLYRFEHRTDIPAHGYLLLVHEGESVDVLADGYFDTPLFNRGSLFLRNAERENIDIVGWGEAPEDGFLGAPAPAVENGQSLLRIRPISEDNSKDFNLSESPTPQNSGEVISREGISNSVEIFLPQNTGPGQEFALIFVIANNNSDEDKEIFLSLYIPEGYEPVAAGVELTAERRLEGAQIIPAGASLSFELAIVAPYTYEQTIFSGSYIEVDGLRRYAPISHVSIAGGSVPIGVARELEGQTVTIEGIATMYTGGFYAGSTGTKFYIEDETGGVQVYVPEGIRDVAVNLGDRVRVTGQQEIYRTSVEIIPDDYTTDIEVIEKATPAIEPAAVPLSDLMPDGELIGRLVTLEGIATRIEEFTYSYEVDLTDEDGNSVRIYLDKLTEATTEPLAEGESYQITGIAEMYDGNVQLQPRLQSDFAQIFPPTLRLEVDAPITSAAEAIPLTIRAINNTPDTLTNIILTADLPTGAVETINLGNGVSPNSDIIKWAIPTLAAGETFTISYQVTTADGPAIQFPAVSATADQLSEPVASPVAATYLGDTLPIYAIQGDGFSSPYTGQTVTTEGIVTAIFPELDGLWIQNPAEDNDEATSEGLFVLTAGLETAVDLSEGESIRLTGKVRELSGQTTLAPITADAIMVIPNLGNYAVVELEPPADLDLSLAYFEALEGMMVKVSDGVAVAPINHFGEYAVVRPETSVSRVMRNDGQQGLMIFVDDGSMIRHEDASTLPYSVATGDLVSGLIGPLAFTFDQYKIEPLTPPLVTAEAVVLPELPPLGANQFSVATFNVENLFDTSPPHPDNPPRPNDEQYQIKLTKIADAILRMGAPTIIGLQEVENLAILEELATQPELADFAYVAILEEGSDSRGIDNGYLVRGDVATIEEIEAIDGPDGLTSRPPLLIQVTIELDGGSQTLFLLNNHFTSMSAGEEATEPRRDAQAAWNVEIVADIISDVEGDPAIIVMGDLNSFYDAKPLDTLRAGGLNHVYEFLEATGDVRPYTYIYQGSGQTLDHILVTPNLFDHLTAVTALHLNADFPFAAVDDLSAQRVSDHDPLIAVFTMD